MSGYGGDKCVKEEMVPFVLDLIQIYGGYEFYVRGNL
jgi:hypothetical protein